MDDSTINANSIVVDSVGTYNGITPGNWSGSPVAPIESSSIGAFIFLGWHNIINTKQVDPTASSFTIPHSDSYNPNTSNLQIYVWVKADNPAAAVSAGYMVRSDS